MKTLDEFKTFYEEEVADAISDAQQEIKTTELDGGELSLLARVKASLIVGGAVLLIMTPFVYFGGKSVLTALFFAGVTVLVMNVVGPEIRKSLLKAAQVDEIIKKNVAGKIVSFFGDDFSLNPDGEIETETINQSLTFPSRAEVALGEDYVEGTVGDTDVAFSEVTLYTSELASGHITIGGMPEGEEKQTRKAQKMMQKGAKNDPDAHVPEDHFFGGVYLIADFHKHFRGHTIVRPTDGDADPGGRLETEEGSSLGRLEQVHLEDPELESLYNVYGTDQQQARYILSTSMMERVKAFRERTGKTVSFSFYESNMHIAVPYERDLLEVRGASSMDEFLADAKGEAELDLLEDLVDREQVFTYFEDLRFILGIVEDFDLNTRIWLKE